MNAKGVGFRWSSNEAVAEGAAHMTKSSGATASNSVARKGEVCVLLLRACSKRASYEQPISTKTLLSQVLAVDG